MIDIEKSIREVKSFLFDDNSYNLNCEKIWYGTTESIKDYFELLDWKNTERVLTVCSSGDHIFNLVHRGIKQIDAFDSNPLTFPYFNLRAGMLSAFSYQDYFRFFEKLSIASSNEKQEYEIFSSVKDFIPYPYDNLWKQLYVENCIMNQHDIAAPGLLAKLCYNYIPFRINQLRNQFLSSEEDYNRTKENLKRCNIQFQCADFTHLHEKFCNRYDKVLLSNISDYLPFPFNRSFREFDSFIRDRLSSILNDDGEILAAYMYHYVENGETRGIHFKEIYDNNISMFQDDYQVLEVNHINDFSGVEYGSRDAVLVYGKK